ncbi:MAG: M14 family metallopeptidase [Ekhidna sp.]
MGILITLFTFFPFLLIAQLKSPEDYLGYELGEKFTRHHQVVDYYTYISESSEKVTLKQYGNTYENRPLVLAYVSTPENLANLEQIREDNLKRAGIVDGTPSTNVAIVWLSYNVHGNESSSTEASLKTLHELARENSDKENWLENTVVIIDPCVNPDGRDRYVNFYWQYGAVPYNPAMDALEHQEEWPGGRANHYLFDLNRDWAWQTQIETQQRLREYNLWLPHVHVDFHEQSHNSPYYFAPAAKPYHELITQFQRDFQVEIGKNHAKYFDDNNWFYFTKQRFDLLYPSYGDTYPTYNGAIGMTYEQGGGGRAGLGIINQEGDTLTLKDRLLHHHTTGLSTIEIASKNADRLLSQFSSFFGNNAGLKYKSFVLKYDGNSDKFNAIKAWFDDQGIEYGASASAKSLRGYEYSTGRTTGFSVDRNDLVISMDQPKATLAHILLEPKTKLEDSVTYDITAWGVPYAYGVEAYATETLLSVTPQEPPAFEPNDIPQKVYAFINKWNSMDDARFLAALLKENIKVRFTKRRMIFQGETFDRGSLIITARDNKRVSDFESKVVRMANMMQRKLSVVSSGFMDAGPDIGSSDVRYLDPPRIAAIGYEGTSSLSFGAFWHFMEQDLNYPVTILASDYLRRVDLSEYDVLVMPDGWYSNFGEGEMKKIMDWVANGGKLIAIRGAINKLKDSDYSSLRTHADDDAKNEFESKEEERSELAKMVPYEELERDYMKRNTPGAIYKVKMDNTNPLAYGYSETYYTLKTSSGRAAYLDGNNVGVIRSTSDLMSGFSGQYALQDVAESLVFGVESKGRGQIVHIIDDPLFRSFWQNGKLLIVNAMFFVGQ